MRTHFSSLIPNCPNLAKFLDSIQGSLFDNLILLLNNQYNANFTVKILLHLSLLSPSNMRNYRHIESLNCNQNSLNTVLFAWFFVIKCINMPKVHLTLQPYLIGIINLSSVQELFSSRTPLNINKFVFLPLLLSLWLLFNIQHESLN